MTINCKEVSGMRNDFTAEFAVNNLNNIKHIIQYTKSSTFAHLTDAFSNKEATLINI